MTFVASELQAPLKIIFETTSGSSLLGLGDILAPGLLLAMNLRFDLWRYYQRKIKYVATELQTEMRGDEPNSTISTTNTGMRAVKALYFSPHGRWGDRLWTFSWTKPLPPGMSTPGMRAAAFPKPYFFGGLAGYAVGMLVAAGVALVTKEGQPALLYLVPATVISTWMTGFVRGEIKDMMTYKEGSDFDTKDIVVEVGPDGQVIKEVSDKEERMNKNKTTLSSTEKSEGEKEEAADGKPGKGARKSHKIEVALVTVSYVPVDPVDDDFLEYDD